MLALSIASEGCNTEPNTTDFVVDNPAGNGDSGLTGGGEDGGDPAGEDDGENGGDDGGREISEADIVFVEGDRVYALSAYAGLVVVDAANPDQGLPVLGRYRMHAQPFEMYVEDGQVFVMTNDYGSYDYDEQSGGYVWHSSSRLLALDARDPASIVSRGEFELPGSIQDSRRVGDVLYLVTFEDGWCWGCEENQPRTVVSSLDVSNPAQAQVVDQLVFANQTDDEWDWAGPRSVSSTDERMYIGGIEYDDWESAHSTIDVVDISDPGGALVRGASVEVAGQIQSRWQMDEHEGALRVISQPWTWASNEPPTIQTFSVASASEIAPLASVPMACAPWSALICFRPLASRVVPVEVRSTMMSAVPALGSVASMVSTLVSTCSGKWKVMNTRPGRSTGSCVASSRALRSSQAMPWACRRARLCSASCISSADSKRSSFFRASALKMTASICGVTARETWVGGGISQRTMAS